MALLAALLLPPTTAWAATDQIQAFQFALNTALPVLPVTYTCPSPLAVSKTSYSNAKTDDPKGPYSMVALVHELLYDGAGIQYERVYSVTVGLGQLDKMTEVAHPWGNGTQFIACMWSANAVSGGCQDLFTVVPSADLTAAAYQNTSSTCRTPNVLESWVTPANETLDVSVTGVSGDLAINAWPPSCSDIQFTPKNGTAPYTLLIAPAAHPPLNITSSDTSSINYTVHLTHGQAFMAALYDSAGNSWAYGPLHAGYSDNVKCLGVATGEEADDPAAGYGLGALVGGVAGAFVVGALGAGLLLFFLFRRPRRPKRSESTEDLYANPRPYRTSSHHTAHSNTASLYTKPLLPNDTPEFDTPATLYDPHMAGPGGYPQGHVKRGSAGTVGTQGRESISSARPFPRPPLHQHSSSGEYVNPYTPSPPLQGGGNYRDNIILADFGAGQRRGSGSPRSTGMVRPVEGENNGQSQETSYISRRSAPGPGISPRLPASPGPSSHGRFPSAPAPSSPSPRFDPFNPPTQPLPPTPFLQHQNRSGSFHSLPGAGESPPASPGRMRNVYVVHADGGAGADVTIQLPGPNPNTHIIELPPNYRRTPSPPRSSPSLTPLIPGGHDFSPPPLRGGGELELVRSRASALSGLSVQTGTGDMGADELRARAEAAIAEKDRPL
ncbi:hypothetical protein L202_03611 [Cryptococcus amylolentus CBS 6039]|uniref:Mid2 domain-containing protein n=1 Tax=Cryptococcus amylolentus CBS 6039 TaxID=1295533 RepID=A0A1E3HVS6_9TREE|nr:hypothetical protein L202_03611 [Cryptococcus amylolentus CBS 6039]ODN79681.1 hypothetical protein L202_03611 [Cryptococcus amylolentus CBS 6039]